LEQLLAFIYTIAHWAGGLIVGLVENIISLPTPANLVDPIGYLALLTVFLIVAEVAKKVVWGIVVVGWLSKCSKNNLAMCVHVNIDCRHP
jgi:hypothetical protein